MKESAKQIFQKDKRCDSSANGQSLQQWKHLYLNESIILIPYQYIKLILSTRAKKNLYLLTFFYKQNKKQQKFNQFF